MKKDDKPKILGVLLEVPFNVTRAEFKVIETGLGNIVAEVLPRNLLNFRVAMVTSDHTQPGISCLCEVVGGDPGENADLRQAVELVLHGLGRKGNQKFKDVHIEFLRFAEQKRG